MPGNAIESMWFPATSGRAAGNEQMIRQAAEVVRWDLEAGRVPEFGGILLGIDVRRNAPAPPTLKEIWRLHVEASRPARSSHYGPDRPDRRSQ